MWLALHPEYEEPGQPELAAKLMQSPKRVKLTEREVTEKLLEVFQSDEELYRKMLCYEVRCSLIVACRYRSCMGHGIEL